MTSTSTSRPRKKMDDQNWRRLQMTTKYKFGKVEKKEVKSNQRGKGCVGIERIDTDCK